MQRREFIKLGALGVAALVHETAAAGDDAPSFKIGMAATTLDNASARSARDPPRVACTMPSFARSVSEKLFEYWDACANAALAYVTASA